MRDNVLVPESLEGAKHKQGVALKENIPSSHNLQRPGQPGTYLLRIVLPLLTWSPWLQHPRIGGYKM